MKIGYVIGLVFGALILGAAGGVYFNSHTGGQTDGGVLASGLKAVTIEIDPETGAGGFVLPNDRVDILSARTGADETILRNIRVLAIDQKIVERDGQKVLAGKQATLELTPSQQETVQRAGKRGKLRLSLRSIADDVKR